MKGSYQELLRIGSFKERFLYLQKISKSHSIGKETFGSKRGLNQNFYKSSEWKAVRKKVIIRDDGMDLGIGLDSGKISDGEIVIHHINPISSKDFINGNPMLLDLNNLITASKRTHSKIHYGGDCSDLDEFIERQPGDTKLW